MYKALYIASLETFLRRKWESESVFKRKFSDKYLKKFYIKINKKKTYRGFFGDGHFRTNAKWFVRSFVFLVLILEPTRAISAFAFRTYTSYFWLWFFLAYYVYLCYTKDKRLKENEDTFTMRVLLRYKEPVCLLLSFAAILLVVTVYGLTHGFDSSATVDHKSPQILQELLPVDE